MQRVMASVPPVTFGLYFLFALGNWSENPLVRKSPPESGGRGNRLDGDPVA